MKEGDTPLFELTRRPLRALNAAYVLPLELQRIKDIVWCAMLGAEVQGNRLEQLMQTLIVRWLKMHLFLLLQKLGGPKPALVPPVRPPP